MATTADHKAPTYARSQVRGWPLTRVPRLVWAVIASRLLVLSCGVAGALMFGRLAGWQMVDPTHLSTSFGAVGNALLAASLRWDAMHYLSIAQHGYKPAGDTGFFPFYPLLIRSLSWVVQSEVAAALLISVSSFAVALILLHRITREELGERVADATVLLLAFAPLTLFFTAIYTESLLLALSVGTFSLARQRHFRWACVAAACATLTQVEGLVLFAPVAFMLWEAKGRRRDLAQLFSWDAAALLLPPAAFLGLLFYLHSIGFGWLAPFTGANPTGHGYSIAPLSFGLHHTGGMVRTVVGPFVTIWHAVVAGLVGFDQTARGAVPIAPGLGDVFTIGFQNLVYLVVLVITLSALVGTWRLLPKAYAIYTTLVILVFTMSDVTVIPIRAFDRYMLPVFPLWMICAKWLEERRLLRVVLVISPVLLGFYTIEFTRWAMIA